MGLVGINPVRAQPKKDTLDRIAQAIGIAESILGTSLAIPKILQERKATEIAERKQAFAEGKEFREVQPEELARFEEVQPPGPPTAEGQLPARQMVQTRAQAPGLVGMFRAPEGSVFGGGELVVPRGVKEDESDLSAFEKQLFQAYSKDFEIAGPDDPGVVEVIIGGRKVFFKKRVDEVGKSEVQKREDDLRKEFLKASNEFVSQVSSMVRVNRSAKDPSAAGDLALIFNFMKILDPASVVRESEFANAANSAGVPERIRAQYNKVVEGKRLSDVQRKDFFNRAKELFKGARLLHNQREGVYTRLANEKDVNPTNVVIPLGLVKTEKITPENF